MEEEKKVDQAPLARDISSKINIEFADGFLVKPLEKIKVKKTFSKPVPKSDKPKKDKNGVTAVDYDKVETEVKEVDSDYREGIVLKVPFQYRKYMNEKDGVTTVMPIEVGDTIIYEDKAAKFFDLIKDTQIVKHYNIIAKKTK